MNWSQEVFELVNIHAATPNWHWTTSSYTFIKGAEFPDQALSTEIYRPYEEAHRVPQLFTTLDEARAVSATLKSSPSLLRREIHRVTEYRSSRAYSGHEGLAEVISAPVPWGGVLDNCPLPSLHNGAWKEPIEHRGQELEKWLQEEGLRGSLALWQHEGSYLHTGDTRLDIERLQQTLRDYWKTPEQMAQHVQKLAERRYVTWHPW